MDFSKKLIEIYHEILEKILKTDNICADNTKRHIQEIINLLDKGDFGKAHHKICELMFETAENGEELWVRIDHIYREEDNADFGEQSLERKGSDNYIEISILTPTMLEYDRKMFGLLSEGINQNIYRPYFYHFLLDIDSADNAAINFIANTERLNQWYEGSFNPNWSEYDVSELPGFIEKTASPVVYSGAKLKIADRLLSKKIVDEINATYSLGVNPCSNDSYIQNELKVLLGGTNFTKGRIYHVGTGNCIYLRGKNGSFNNRLLFDIGYHVSAIPSKSIVKSRNLRVTQAIRSLRPSCVILSHWDSDHYKGCAYGNRHIFECRWIAPNCDDATPNAKRLAKYLKVKEKLLLVDRTHGRNICTVKGSVSELKVWMGELVTGIVEDMRITKPNRQGLVLELSNGTKNPIHCIMMGDVPYRSLSNIMNFTGLTPVDYLVVPHHGAYMNTSLVPKPTKTKRGLAIVCAIKGKNRPNHEHETALHNNGYDVKLTEESVFSIELDLNIKGSWHFRC